MSSPEEGMVRRRSEATSRGSRAWGKWWVPSGGRLTANARTRSSGIGRYSVQVSLALKEGVPPPKSTTSPRAPSKAMLAESRPWGDRTGWTSVQS